jgi:hypothetical protein
MTTIETVELAESCGSCGENEWRVYRPGKIDVMYGCATDGCSSVRFDPGGATQH